MKAIDLRQALIEANNVNLNGADALVETRAMRQLIESCKARIEELEPLRFPEEPEEEEEPQVPEESDNSENSDTPPLIIDDETGQLSLFPDE